MKPRLLYSLAAAILTTTFGGFCVDPALSQPVDESIRYIPYYHDKQGSFMILDCILNDSIAAPFETDSGVTGSDIIMDKAFFLNISTLTISFTKKHYLGKRVITELTIKVRSRCRSETISSPLTRLLWRIWTNGRDASGEMEY